MRIFRVIVLLAVLAAALIVALFGPADSAHEALFVALIAAFLASDGAYWPRGRHSSV